MLGVPGATVVRPQGRTRRLAAWPVATGALILAGAAFSLGASEGPAKVLRAERFELLAEGGGVVGVMGTTDGKYPYLELSQEGDRSTGGKVRIEVPFGKGPSITVFDGAGQAKIQMYLDLGAIPFKGAPEETNRTRMLATGQNPQLVFLGGHEKAHGIRAVFGSRLDATAELEIMDKDGNVVFRAPEE